MDGRNIGLVEKGQNEVARAGLVILVLCRRMRTAEDHRPSLHSAIPKTKNKKMLTVEDLTAKIKHIVVG